MSPRAPVFGASARRLAVAALVVLSSGSSCSQTPDPEAARPASRPDLYACDGCEAAEERAPESLEWQVTIPPDGEPGERLVLSGRVLLPDGETPAPGVVLYVHQTNTEGLYRSIRSTERGGRGDGILEGWLATDAAGRYEIRTIRPAPYPDAEIPAHVHVYVKEPERRPYYIDDFVFEGDPHVTADYRAAQELRGGSGIVRLARADAGGWRAERDIVLEP